MKDSFLLFTEHKDAIGALSDEDAGKLLKAMYAFHAGDESASEALPPMAKILFLMLKPVFERSQTKYEETVQKRREAGAKGGRAKAANASASGAGEAGEANEANASTPAANEANAKSAILPDLANSKACLSESDSESDSESVYTPPLPPSPGGAACVPPASPPLSGEDIAERQDAERAERRRGDYEFSLLRSEYDKARQEGPMAGRQEFLQLFGSPDWPGVDEILAGLQRLLEQDDQFRRGFAPGLGRFVRERMWAMAPRAPAGEKRPEASPDQEAAKKRLEELQAKLRAQKQNRRT